MIDLLHAVDWIVDAPRDTAQLFSEVLSIPPAPHQWVHRLEPHEYEAVFMKTTDDLAQAPTRLEFIVALEPRPAGGGCSAAPVRLVQSLQRPRPQLTHATVLCVADFEAYTESLRARGTSVWVETPCDHLPHRRGWVGWTHDGVRWLPGDDHGLFFEYIPSSVLGRRVPASVASAEAPTSPRVTRRVHLVEDLDTAVAGLDRRMGLVPADDVQVDQDLGARIATYDFGHRASASLVLAEPSGDGPAADYVAAWGGGPWLTSFAVPDPTAVVAQAVETGSAALVAGMAGPVLELPPGCLVELAPL